MPYGTPQSMMYSMRGRGTDGSMIRNRSREQQFSGSGNPAMPIFNTGRMDPRQPQGGLPGQPIQYGVPMPQFPQAPQGGMPGTSQVMGGTSQPQTPAVQGYTPAQLAAQQAVMTRFNAGGYPANPGSMSAVMPNINYNTQAGVSPFAAAIAAMHSGKNPAPMPNIDTSRNPTGYAPPPAAPVNTYRNPTQYAPVPGSYNG